jgi:NAD(P)-dependent dehydrogenase (short-subunit alcohol dehydrogenase family)
MKDFAGKVAVITGGASGLGRAFAEHAAGLKMRVVLADVEEAALAATAESLRATGTEVIAQRCNVARDEDVAALAALAWERCGGAHLLFNNAGVGGRGGYLWEGSAADWRWVTEVNVFSVAHGIRHFVPRWIAAGAGAEDAHIVNTASIAGWLCGALMAGYNASKAAVVSLTETLHHDLQTAGSGVGVSLLCPAFVPTGIALSERNRPDEAVAPPTASQKVALAAATKAVASGRMSAAEVAEITFAAIRARRFYVFTHPQLMPLVKARWEALNGDGQPADPYAAKPSVRPR